MPRPFPRRLGPAGTAILLYDVWRRLPPAQRRWVIDRTRLYGPRIAKQVMEAQKNRRRR